MIILQARMSLMRIIIAPGATRPERHVRRGMCCDILVNDSQSLKVSARCCTQPRMKLATSEKHRNVRAPLWSPSIDVLLSDAARFDVLQHRKRNINTRRRLPMVDVPLATNVLYARSGLLSFQEIERAG